MISILESRASTFAAKAHDCQFRKYTFEPYIEHPRAVASLVRSVPHTEEQIAAAWLHDTVEDTETTIDDIGRDFGPIVAVLVSELTDVSRPEDGNRKIRKALDREHLAKASPAAKTVKLADLIDNSASITKHDPKFAVTYLEEKRALLDVLKEGDRTLWDRAYAIAWGTK